MDASNRNSAPVIFGRIFWVMLGPLLLTATGLMIVLQARSGWTTGADITFLVTLILMVLARLAEFSGGHPETATGGTATGKELRRFIAFVLFGGLAFYVLANMLSNYLLA